MNKILLRSLLVSTAMGAALPMTAVAQDGAENGADTFASGEIIVTARRSEESLQNVPVSIQVVGGEALQDLAITSVEEVSKLAPGLTLVNAGSSTEVTLRGVTWQPASGTPATPIYFNEVPFDPGNTIVSLFDVGQIEVLRGPQGTTRGAPSISGAVTISTRKPDLDEFGGFVQGLYGSGDHWAIQAAVNAPIIRDVLAIRLAANVEESNANRINSVNSLVQPFFKDRSYRATVLFQPTDTISVQAMYQRRKTLTKEYSQVVGSGSPGLAQLGIQPNFNGPALTLKDRASVQDLPSDRPQHVDLLTVNANWEVFGHQLSYNYGRQFNRSPAVFNAVDTLNIIPGFEDFTSPAFNSLPKWRTHEIRFSSLPDPDRPFDYDIGWFSKRSDGPQVFSSSVYLPGAFGAPFQSVPGQVSTPNPRYVLPVSTNIGIGQVFDSFYGNVRFYITDNTELSGGLAIVRDRVPVSFDVVIGAAVTALSVFLPPPSGCQGISQFLPPSADYGPGYCESAVPAGTQGPDNFNDEFTAGLYNFSLSHKFSDAVLVYATTGSSFRSGLPSIGNAGLPSEFLVPKPERAKSYEIGVKTTLARGLRVNAAVFQLDYKNQLTSFAGTQFFSSIPGGGVRATNVSFYQNIDAKVRGFEVEVAANPMRNLSFSANASYSKIKSQGGSVPCNDPTRPLTATNTLNFCSSAKGETLNTQPPFQASAFGSYEVPFSDAIGAYFRFNVSYQGKNPNFGNFRSPVDGSFLKTEDYAIVDLFAGLNGNDSGWDLGFYAKNVFDKQVELDRVATPNSIYPLFAAPAGYDVVRSNRPREIGISARFSFGSR